MTILAIALNPTVDISSIAQKVEPTHKIRTRNQRWHAGGGGVNVARVIRTLGGEPELLITSGGAAGALLEEAVVGAGIRTNIIELKSPTRIAYMVYEEETGLEYRFVPEGPEVPEKQYVQILEAVRNFKGGYVVASGSLPRGVPQDTYAVLARIAAANGARYVLDTSGEAFTAALDAGVGMFLVKPSRSELESYAGHALDEKGAEEAARDIVAKGKSNYVALSLGSDGALLAGPSGVIRKPAIKVEVKSAVGAGDSFVAGLVWKLSQGASVEQAFDYAMAVGAAAAMTAGTELCNAEDVERLLAAQKG